MQAQSGPSLVEYLEKRKLLLAKKMATSRRDDDDGSHFLRHMEMICGVFRTYRASCVALS